ncbi:COG3547 Transposase and inactivated derivatives [Vibrio sp. B1FIG11]|uniref:hypothetical protein n=1 Tax=Vibrio sp. B1FIG11 TaxID=2751177 RepID=UPI001AFB53CE|nr:hypothetical protein [Vibrio sp. B1FIG11]CAD7798819.1 COG3547 Transposase and inactivated derivatives [Vibrio sp. B1FIG11]CAE6883545.1 COG3547 Transposase and inactivated derivatives [Vibrio sp. B1FIG11]
MSTIHILGIDLGKHYFHANAHKRSDVEVLRRKFNRNRLQHFLCKIEPTTIAFEACGGAHWLARKCGEYSLLPSTLSLMSKTTKMIS